MRVSIRMAARRQVTGMRRNSLVWMPILSVLEGASARYESVGDFVNSRESESTKYCPSGA
jgi:hypothetical protein